PRPPRRRPRPAPGAAGEGPAGRGHDAPARRGYPDRRGGPDRPGDHRRRPRHLQGGAHAMMKFFPLLLKNLWRSKTRSALTALAIVFLVAIFTMIATVLRFLDNAMTEKSRDVPMIVTQRYRIPSMFDRSWVDRIASSGADLNTDLSRAPGFHGEKH